MDALPKVGDRGQMVRPAAVQMMKPDLRQDFLPVLRSEPGGPGLAQRLGSASASQAMSLEARISSLFC